MAFVGNTQLIAGTGADVPRILELLAESGFNAEQNPDLYVRTYAHFGVEEARELRERAGLRAVSSGASAKGGTLGKRRAFVLAMPGMTTEAQNALLKTLEEPPADAVFFFIVPAPDMLLPTLRSRAQMYSLGASAASIIDIEKFLALPVSQRLEALKPLLEKGEDDRRDMSAALMFLSSLERMLSTRDPRDEGIRSALEALYRARKYADDKGSLIKPLLEQVALLTPVIS